LNSRSSHAQQSSVIFYSTIPFNIHSTVMPRVDVWNHRVPNPVYTLCFHIHRYIDLMLFSS
jgi:hypothetical protein